MMEYQWADLHIGLKHSFTASFTPEMANSAPGGPFYEINLLSEDGGLVASSAGVRVETTAFSLQLNDRNGSTLSILQMARMLEQLHFVMCRERTRSGYVVQRRMRPRTSRHKAPHPNL